MKSGAVLLLAMFYIEVSNARAASHDAARRSGGGKTGGAVLEMRAGTNSSVQPPS